MRRTAVIITLALVATLAAPAPVAAQIARVSVSSAGVQADGPSEQPSVSFDGRYVAFASRATTLVPGDTNGVRDIFVHDRDADLDGVFDEPGAVLTRRITVREDGVEANGDSTSPRFVGGHIVFLSRATNLVPGLETPVQRVFSVWEGGGPFLLISRGVGGAPAENDCEGLTVGTSSSGHKAAYRSMSRTLAPGAAGLGGAIYVNLFVPPYVADAERVSPPLYPDAEGRQPVVGDPAFRADASLLTYPVRTTTGSVTDGRLFLTDRNGTFTSDLGPGVDAVLNSDGTVFVVALRDGPGPDPTSRGLFQPTVTHPGPAVEADDILVSYSGRYAAFVGPHATVLHDFVAGETHTLPIGSIGGAGWSAFARFLALASTDATLVPGDTNGVADIVVVDLPRYLDADADGLDDRWERLSGLDPGSALGDDGPLGDPDGDGVTNRDEFATADENLPPGSWRHPKGLVRRYVAEGAENGFFATRLALVNPDPAHAASVLIRYRLPSHSVTQPLRIPPRGRRTSLPSALFTLRGGDPFAIEIESDRPVVANREMSWDATGYGASVETSQEPATTWHFAEGTTAADFALFYLLHNPQPTTVSATVRYLRPSGPVIEHSYLLAAHSRTTIEVGLTEPALRDTDVSAEIVAADPIVAERAMYASRHGQAFAVGHAAAGARAASTDWFLAEGATGTFFDLFVLVANPGAAPATVALEFLRPDGTTIGRTLQVPPHARRSVYVDDIAGLEATSVSTRATSNVPIVVERAMYWPGGFYDYEEGHASAGSTVTATRWALAQGDDGGPRHAQSFVLIANVGGAPGEARVTILGEREAATTQTVSLPAHSRVTVRVGSGRTDTFGVLVESLGASPAPIVVEGSYYWSPGGRLWAAGANVLATPLP